MSRISAQVIADSLNPYGKRITTMVVTFPRIILAEFNTHRMFSRNSASSRAIPFEKMVKSVQENPFVPMAWQKDHKGMQGSEYANNAVANDMRDQWLSARDTAINKATILSQYGCTKQLCNRLLEPFMWHTVIVTATDWENFFSLRCPEYEIPSNREFKGQLFRSKKDVLKALKNNGNYETTVNLLENNGISEIDWLMTNKGQAEIHMMALAEAMWDVMNESTPKQLQSGEWHIPFGNDIRPGILKYAENYMEGVGHNSNEAIDITNVKISTAMCARVSYTVVGEEGKEPNYANDIALHDRLLKSGHMSPFEHCAKVMDEEDYVESGFEGVSGNFTGGWEQYRKMIPNENRV